jgi:hypothetical protein
VLPQNANNLLFGKSLALHRLALSLRARLQFNLD